MVLAGAAGSCGAAGGLQRPGRGWLCLQASQGRKQEYGRSWSHDSGLVDTKPLQIGEECEIVMYATCTPVLNQLSSLFVREMRETAVHNAFFPEVAHCSVALLLFRIFIPEAFRNTVCVSNQILQVTSKELLRKPTLKIRIMES